jgi:ribosomal protein S12 methylthiotransferase accessory factor
MFGEETLQAAIDSADGKVTFFGLTETDMNLLNQEKHLKLINSYQKLRSFRAKN